MLRRAPLLLAIALSLACAGPTPIAGIATRGSGLDLRTQIVRSAEAMIGTPYRYGGSDPKRGFDCSGLVRYSYARAGVDGLPRTASALESHAVGIRLSELRPADLLFFDLEGRKTQHVGIYAGGGEFIHAPSPGKRVERVSFDHVYWREKLNRAGRLLP